MDHIAGGDAILTAAGASAAPYQPVLSTTNPVACAHNSYTATGVAANPLTVSGTAPKYGYGGMLYDGLLKSYQSPANAQDVSFCQFQKMAKRIFLT